MLHWCWFSTVIFALGFAEGFKKQLYPPSFDNKFIDAFESYGHSTAIPHGGKLELEIRVDPLTARYVYNTAWLFNGKPIFITEEQAQEDNRTFDTSQEWRRSGMTLWPVELQDAGNYTAVITNEFGSKNVTFSVTVGDFGPIILGEKHDSFWKQTRLSVQLNCTILGRPDPVVKWSFQRISGQKWVPIPSKFVPLQNSKGIKLLKRDFSNDALLLGPLTEYMTGIYKCEASSTTGVASRLIEIHVSGSPSLTPTIQLGAPKNASVIEGSDHEFTCPFMSSGFVTVIWARLDFRKWKEANHLQYPDQIYAKLKGDGHILQEPRVDLMNITTKENRYVVKSVSAKDTGPYTCFAFNEFGQDFGVAWLRIAQPPPIVSRSWVLMLAGFLLLTAFAVILYLAVCKRRNKKAKKKIIIVNSADLYPMSTGNLDVMVQFLYSGDRTCLVSESEYIIEPDPDWEIDRKRLQIAEIIGEGAFGRVQRARLDTTQDVAVKSLLRDAKDDDMLQLVTEMETMKALGTHPHIINFVGGCTQGGAVWVVVEYAKHGNLRDYLRENSDSFSDSEGSYTGCELVRFGQEIAVGMDFLSNRGFLHRDLAARNILITAELTAKISDFGLTRGVTVNSDYYRKTTTGQLPIKWMSPESLNDSIYTSKSDVWSYGVLLWEIFSLGESPYGTVTLSQLLMLLQRGERLPQPKRCCDRTYSLMRACWSCEASDRPDFAAIRRRLRSGSDSQYDSVSTGANSSVAAGSSPHSNVFQDDSALTSPISLTAPLMPSIHSHHVWNMQRA